MEDRVPVKVLSIPPKLLREFLEAAFPGQQVQNAIIVPLLPAGANTYDYVCLDAWGYRGNRAQEAARGYT